MTSLNLTWPDLPQVTEDMSRGARQGWCELQRFMLRVLDRYPHSQASLATHGGTLTVDQRVFVWDRQAAKVEEQVTVTIPIQGDIVTSATSHVRWDNNRI